MFINTLNKFSGRSGKQREQADVERRTSAEAFFSRLAREGLSSRQLFARILEDPEAFEHAVIARKLQALIPELDIFEENMPARDPNIYRPMPLTEHMYEAIRQTFGWVGSFGEEEYKCDVAKKHSLLWINTALLFHDQGEIAILKGTNLPLWYQFTVEWTKKKRKNILRETYPFFGVDAPESRSYIDHLRHPEISARLAAAPLFRLGWNPRAIRVVQFLVRNHSVLIEKATYGRIKDGRVLHEDLYEDIVSVHEETGVAKEDLLKMLQVVQIMDARAVKSGMAQIPQETMMRVWMAYSYMNIVLAARNSARRSRAFKNYRKAFNRIRKEMPFGTPFNASFNELLSRIAEKDGSLDEEDRKLLEEELGYFERFEIIREDHIHINNQFNLLLHLIERKACRELSGKEKAVLLQAYKIAYRSHDGQFRRAFKIFPTGDKRRKYIEHPIKVARILVETFGVTDPLSIAAVLFHDVLEDTDIDADDILAAFKNEDEKGRITNAITILTKPTSRKILKGRLHKELAYLLYIAGILAGGCRILGDRELFEWLRFILPRIKAADKIHNRRTLSARKPEGRIKEICRNENTLVMFMEASNLTPEEKLKVLEEYDKSFFEVFGLLDLKEEENKKRFRESLSLFRQFVWEQLSGIEAKQTEKTDAIKAFDDALQMLARYPENPEAASEKLRDMEQALPRLCLKMGLDDQQKAAVIDEFAFFLFNVSEVGWLTDEGKRKIIRFQSVIRRYKEKITGGEWEPETAGFIDVMARYAQGYGNALPPIVRFGGLPDFFELLSKVPFTHRLYDRSLGMMKRKLVAHLLPCVAMLPIRQIHWLKGDDVQSIEKALVEREMGGLSVENRSGRVVIRIHPALARPGPRNARAADPAFEAWLLPAPNSRA